MKTDQARSLQKTGTDEEIDEFMEVSSDLFAHIASRALKFLIVAG